MSIAQNLSRISEELTEGVTLVAVSKTKPVEDLQEAYDCGQRVFGENKIQEMAAKYEQLPKDIQWHMIGHVQTNKIKYMAPFVSLVHGCDRVKVLKELNKEARKNNRVIDCLLQVHIAQEETKFGFSEEEILAFAGSEEAQSFENINIVGLMGMATFTDDKDQIEQEFRTLAQLFNSLKDKSLFTNFSTLSMGMSGDYGLAIECGSNMVRIGSSIFGARNYN
ncbi:MAG: YggS family pyridoxal phosphate-dependent enzyme [Schleiferiaceae bacterium]